MTLLCLRCGRAMSYADAKQYGAYCGPCRDLKRRVERKPEWLRRKDFLGKDYTGKVSL